VAATVANAVVERLAATLPDDTIYSGIVPDAPVGPRYLVVYADTGTRSSESICGASNLLTVRVQVQSIVFGDGLPLADMCGWLSKAVRDALTDWTPAADDATSLAPMRHDLSLTPRRDEQITARPTVYAVDQFHVDGTYIII
jgi:hypothetical protein